MLCFVDYIFAKDKKKISLNFNILNQSNMHFTAQSKNSTGVLTLKQIILAFALLIVFVGQISATSFSK